MFVYVRHLSDVVIPLSLTAYGTTNYDSVTDTHTFTSDLGNYLYQPGINNPAGGWTHTVTFWMYTDPNDWPEAHNSYVYSIRSGSYIDQGLVGDGSVSQSGLSIKRYGDVFRWLVSFGTRAHITLDVSGDYTTHGFDVGAWVHIAIVCDGYSNTVKIYQNGVVKSWKYPPEAAYTTNADLWNLEANSHLMVGKDPRNTLPFIGKISNFQIYEEVLNATHIQNLMSTGIYDV